MTLPEHSSDLQLALFCAFTLLLHAKPSEPHLVPYLTSVKHFSEQAVVSYIFPVFTYADFAFTLLVAPASQLLGCKRCVVLGAACRLATRFLLLYGTSLGQMQLMQVFFGAGVASEVVFAAFVLSLVPAEQYQRVSSFTSAAALVGYLLASALGQLALSRGASLTSLFYASLVTVGAAFALSLALPPGPPPAAATLPLKRASALAALRGALSRPLRSPQLALLSLFWLLGGTGLAFCENYGIARFFELDPATDGSGTAAAVARSLCAAASLAAVKLETVAAASGAQLYALCSALAALCCLWLASAKTLRAAYAAYAIALALLSFSVCVLTAQCAHAVDDADAALRERRRRVSGTSDGGSLSVSVDDASDAEAAPAGAAGLFAANSGACLALQSVLQAVLAARRRSAQDQFVLLAGFLFLTAAATALAGARLRQSSGSWRLVAEARPAEGGSEETGGLLLADGELQLGERRQSDAPMQER
jgi:thiamine transporter 2/3